jgi:hypothetical protein
MMMINFNKLPQDLFNEKIMPYTYSPQNPVLLKDLLNFNTSKQRLFDTFAHDDINTFIVDFLYEYGNEYDIFMHIITKRFFMNIDKNMHYMYAFSDNRPKFNFNQIWGLMTDYEREVFFDYIEVKLFMTDIAFEFDLDEMAAEVPTPFSQIHDDIYVADEMNADEFDEMFDYHDYNDNVDF